MAISFIDSARQSAQYQIINNDNMSLNSCSIVTRDNNYYEDEVIFNSVPTFSQMVDACKSAINEDYRYIIYNDEYDNIYLFPYETEEIYFFVSQRNVNYGLEGLQFTLNETLYNDVASFESYQNEYGEYSTYSRQLTQNGQVTYFDVYGHIDTSLNDYYRGVANYCVYISSNTNEVFNIGVSNAYSKLDSMSYNNGYNYGYQDGLKVGYDNGYKDGAMSDEMLTAFDYIGQAVGGVSSILNIEILPHMTLGLLITIPATLGIIAMIFRIIKK